MELLQYVLLVLSINANGDIRATISPDDDMAACMEQKETVDAILKTAGADVVKLVCSTTSAKLAPFEHGAGIEDQIYKYRIDLHPDYISILEINDGACSPATNGKVETYCTVSSQRLIKE